MSLAMIANSVSSIIETISNPDTSGLDKVKTIAMSLSGMIPMILMAVKTIGTAIKAEGEGA